MMRVFFLLVVFCCAMPAHALRYVLTPSVGLGGTYDDRVRDDREDWYLRATPGLAFDMQQDNYALRLSADLSAYAYNEYTEYDRIDQRYQFKADYGWSERTSFGLAGSVRLDTDYEDEYEEGRIADVDATDRQTYSLTPTFSRMLTARDRLDVAYTFSMRDNEADYNSDYTAHTVSLTWTRMSSEVLDLFVRGAAQRTAYESSRSGLDSRFYQGELTQDNVSLMGGVTYRPSERLTASLALGGGEIFTRRDESEYDFGGWKVPISVLGFDSDEDDASNFTYLVNSSLEWKGERLTVKGGYDRDIYSSADGEDVVRDSVQGSVSYRVTELLSVGSSVLTRHLQDTGEADSRDDWYYAVNPFLSYRISPDSSMRFGYTYSQTHEKDEDDVEKRNRFSLDYVIAFPKEY